MPESNEPSSPPPAKAAPSPKSSPPHAPPSSSTGGSSSGASTRRVGPRALKLLWDGHSVAGVVLGLGLFVIFFAGAFALYRGELHQWADPALRSASTTVASADAIAQPSFDAHPPAAGTDLLFVYPFANRPYVNLRYTDEAGAAQAWWINPETGDALPAGGRSVLSELLYDLHFFYQLGTAGELLSGLVAVFFLFVLGSGLAIHWNKLPRDLHTFRTTKGLRRTLTDAHNVLGTLGLPFTVMYAVTGAFFSLLTVILAPYVLLVFDGDRSAVVGLSDGIEIPAVEPTGRPAEMPPLDRLGTHIPGTDEAFRLISIQVEAWGDSAAVAVLRGQQDGTLTQTGAAVVQVATGEVLSASTPANTPPLPATVSAFGKLHFARFGGAVVKGLFFLLALAASAVILTGNLLWIEVRRPRAGQPQPRLHRILARLTAGVGAGLVAATPTLFLTTRSLPMEYAGRMSVENGVFFGVWALLIGAAFLGRSPAFAARWQLALGGVLSLLVPGANGTGTGAWPWVSAANNWWPVFWTDIGFLLGGLVLLALAWRLHDDGNRG